MKGAIQFKTTSKVFHATGHGVLSGEDYVYQYVSCKDDGTSLRMWWDRTLSAAKRGN